MNATILFLINNIREIISFLIIILSSFSLKNNFFYFFSSTKKKPTKNSIKLLTKVV